MNQINKPLDPPKNPDAIVPQNMDQIRALLSGRDPRFREPITRREKRAYEKVWHRKGRGYTKPLLGKHDKNKKTSWAKKRAAEAERKREDAAADTSPDNMD